MRRTLLSFIAILLAVVVVLVGMQQWRSWRLDRSLAQASRAVAALRPAAIAVDYKSSSTGCSPKDSELYAAWRNSLREASLALARLEGVHGPGSPHLEALARRLGAASGVISLAKVTCEASEAVRQEYAALIRNQKKARTERRAKARAAVAATVKAGALVVSVPDPSLSFCQAQQPAWEEYLVLERAAFKFVDHPPSAASQGEVAEWREKLLQVRSEEEAQHDACNDRLGKRQ